MVVIDLQKVEKARDFYQAGEDDFKARKYLCAYNNFKLALLFHPGNKLYDAKMKETEWFVIREKADNQFRKGVFCESLQKFDDAETCYRSAIELNPNKAIYHHYLAELIIHSGDQNFEEAKVFCERALEIECENIDILFTMSDIQKGLGDRNEAKKYLKIILNIDPQNNDAKEELAKL